MALIRNKINASIKKPETYRQNFVRINGWTYPLHWLQIIAWFFLLLLCAICFTFIVPTLPNYKIRCTVIVIEVLILILHFISHVVAVSINPADDNVIDKLDKRKDRPTKFDRTKHSHVIENQFCYICETTVGSKSKHCSVCNKCISNFDHHCKWLNNCVGGKNYRWFIFCVLSALMGTIVVFSNCLILTIAYFSENSWLYDNKSTLLFFNNGSKTNESLQIFWIVVIISSLILSLIAFILLTHLLGFHLFLNCVGLSTYDFVVQQRKRQSNKANNLNDSETNKLVSYLKRLQNCIGIAICTKKRVKPFEFNQKTDSKPNDKQIASVFKQEINTKERDKTHQNSDLEKAIEECGKQSSIETKDLKPKSPEKSPQKDQIKEMRVKNTTQFSQHFKEITEKENTINLKTDSNKTMIRENIYENEYKAQNINKVRPKSTSELFSENEPIFMPLNPSFGQNGRMSRLSFTNKKDLIIGALPPDLTFESDLESASDLALINPNHKFVEYNDFNKVMANSVRLNPLNQKLHKFNKNQTINRINKSEINSNDLKLIQNNIRNQM